MTAQHRQDATWAALSASILNLAEDLGESKPDITYLNFSIKEVNDFFDCYQSKRWLKADVSGTLLKLFPRFKRRESWEQLGLLGEEFATQLKIKEPDLEEVLFDNKSKTLWLRFKVEHTKVLQDYCVVDDCYSLEPCPTHSEEAKLPTPFKKDFFRPLAVPTEGIEAAIAVMQSGRLNRYSATAAKHSQVALAEKEFAELTGRKYAVAVNSCSSALLLALSVLEVKAGDHVFSNGFTFTSVPASIVRLGAVPVLVDTAEDWTMDLQDLDRKTSRYEGKVVLLSHMRGKIADMDAFAALCTQRELYVIEDCAHACGVKWNDRQVGYHSLLSVYSTQSDKIVNSGEGGFICTDSDELCAKLIYLSGAYEKRYLKHLLHPAASMCEQHMLTQPNLSLRMSELTAAVMRPMIRNLEERVQAYNKHYVLLHSLLSSHTNIVIPPQHPQVSFVGDHLVFRLRGVSEVQSEVFAATCCKLGVPISGFVSNFNARWHPNWRGFGVPAYELPQTEALLRSSFDLKLPPHFEERDFPHIAQILLHSLDFALATSKHSENNKN